MQQKQTLFSNFRPRGLYRAKKKTDNNDNLCKIHGGLYIGTNLVERLKSSFRKFYGLYGDLIQQYEVPLSRMLNGISYRIGIQCHINLPCLYDIFMLQCAPTLDLYSNQKSERVSIFFFLSFFLYAR